MKWPLWTMVGCTLCVSTGAQADQSVSITLRGVVPETSSIRLVEVNPLISADLRAPVREALVARVLERSNARAGYSIALISENARHGGRAVLRDGGSGSGVPYRLSYDGIALRFENGMAEIGRGTRTRGRVSEIRVSLDGENELPSGAYADTLTVVITAR